MSIHHPRPSNYTAIHFSTPPRRFLCRNLWFRMLVYTNRIRLSISERKGGGGGAGKCNGSGKDRRNFESGGLQFLTDSNFMFRLGFKMWVANIIDGCSICRTARGGVDEYLKRFTPRYPAKTEEIDTLVGIFMKNISVNGLQWLEVRIKELSEWVVPIYRMSINLTQREIWWLSSVLF